MPATEIVLEGIGICHGENLVWYREIQRLAQFRRSEGQNRLLYREQFKPTLEG